MKYYSVPFGSCTWSDYKTGHRTVELSWYQIVLYSVFPKNATTLIRAFQQHSWLNTIDFYCSPGENIFFQVIWHQVDQVCMTRFASRAICSEAVSFSKCATFPPASRLWSCRNFSSHMRPVVYYEKEDYMNEYRGIHYATSWHYQWHIVPHSLQ